MSQQLPNYLRTHRRRTGLSQAEVAFLLGCRGGAKVSRYERHRRQPPLHVALALASVLRVPVAELFAGIADDAEQLARRRALLLRRRLVRCQQNALVVQKLAALHAIAARRVEAIRYEPVRDR